MFQRKEASTAVQPWLQAGKLQCSCHYCYAHWLGHIHMCVIVPTLIITIATLHNLALTDAHMCDSASNICIFATFLVMHVLTDARMCARGSTCHMQTCKLALAHVRTHMCTCQHMNIRCCELQTSDNTNAHLCTCQHMHTHKLPILDISWTVLRANQQLPWIIFASQNGCHDDVDDQPILFDAA